MPERGKPRVSFFVSARFTQKGGSDKKEAGALKFPSFFLFCFYCESVEKGKKKREEENPQNKGNRVIYPTSLADATCPT